MTKLKRSASKVLLGGLVAVIVANPIVEMLDWPGLTFAVEALFGVVLLAAVYAEAPRFSWRHPAVWCVGLAFLFRSAATGFGTSMPPGMHKALLILSELYTAVLMFHLTYVLVRRLTQRDRVNADTVSGIAASYILLIIAFGALHAATFVVEDGNAFRGFEHDLAADLAAGRSSFDQWGPELMYYSAVTQTTLGYGDIVPTTPLARGLAMAQTIIGQLFLAIILARIVAMELSQRGTGGEE